MNDWRKNVNAYFLRISGFLPSVRHSFVTTTVFSPEMSGSSNITSFINFSKMERMPRAPVFCFNAMPAAASMASGVNCSSASSSFNISVNCFKIELSGSVMILTSVSLSNSSNPTVIGSRPMSSGINPNLTKSSE